MNPQAASSSSREGAVRYDLLVAIPPHRGPRLVREAGLANEAGWVPVDRHAGDPHENVYALGDVTAIPIPGRWKPDVPLMLPKAGVFAHAQAQVVARRIAGEITGPARGNVLRRRLLHAGGRRDLAGFAFGISSPNRPRRSNCARSEGMAPRQSAVRAVVAGPLRAPARDLGAGAHSGRQGAPRPGCRVSAVAALDLLIARR